MLLLCALGLPRVYPEHPVIFISQSTSYTACAKAFPLKFMQEKTIYSSGISIKAEFFGSLESEIPLWQINSALWVFYGLFKGKQVNSCKSKFNSPVELAFPAEM